MDYEKFKKQFTAAVADSLGQQGIRADLTHHDVSKPNESYEALTATPSGSNIGVNIAMDKLYREMQNGASFEEVVNGAVDAIRRGFAQKPDIDVEKLSDYSHMKEKLVMEVVSAEANQELLKNIPHQNMEDMAVIYRFVLDSGNDGRASILVTNRIIESMGVTPEQLHADAMENAPQIKPAEIKGMSEVMAELIGLDNAERMGLVLPDPGEEQMFVASVPDKFHGAGVLAYQDFMDQAAERVGGSFYILPSSIHEILIIPDKGHMNVRDLENMVREVNATQVSAEDKLTDNVYHYDAKEKIFELGEKFVARENGRESPEHKEDKRSVLGELKTKKEVAAKTPKKETLEHTSKTKSGEAL